MRCRLSKYFTLSIFLVIGFFAFNNVHAADVVLDTQITEKAQVLEILNQKVENIPGTDTSSNIQTIKVRVLEGVEKGREITVDNDYLNLEKGEVFYLLHTVNSLDGQDYYTVSDPYRVPSVLFFVGLFVACVILLGGKQGLRGLISLIVSFFFIGYLLLPGILNGYSPVLVSIGVSSLIIILGSYITHGFNKTTTAAVVGMVITIILTGIVAFWAIKITRLSGFTNEEVSYLNFDTRGHIDMAGLLLGGMLIGLLGLLYDAAIGQAISVEELHQVGPHLPRMAIYRRAIRIGREHIGALVNTLAIAYVGVSMPLLLLYTTSTADATLTINREIFATEIIRGAVGSIGLILAVPITTIVATLMLVKTKGQVSQAVIKSEEQKTEQIENTR